MHRSGIDEGVMHLFGRFQDRDIREVTLTTADAKAKIIELGAIVRDLEVRRADGQMQRVVLGLNSVEDYIEYSPNFGAILGRFANRIRDGRFVLDGVPHQLVRNLDGKHTLHGGNATGFGKLPWTIVDHNAVSVTLVHVSPDGSNGFPGTMIATCCYTLVGKTLRIALSASTDKATVVNLCSHSYFNLTGAVDILDHTLEVRANVTTPGDIDLIPNGELAAVAETPLDFRRARPIRLVDAGGKRFCYDHTYLLRRDKTETSAAEGMRVAHAATFTAPDASLAMQVWTTEPAMQVYDAYKVNVPVAGLDGARYGANAGLALEPQHVPDSPNLPHFPTTVLRPGELYRQITEYRFT
jgi:aldose 1-epimerase